MNVGQLRKALNNLPDNMPVMIEAEIAGWDEARTYICPAHRHRGWISEGYLNPQTDAARTHLRRIRKPQRPTHQPMGPRRQLHRHHTRTTTQHHRRRTRTQGSQTMTAQNDSDAWRLKAIHWSIWLVWLTQLLTLITVVLAR